MAVAYKKKPPQVPLNPGLRPGDKQLVRYLRKIYGPVQTDAQIQKRAGAAVNAQISPLLAEISRSNQAATDRGAAQIKGDTAQSVAQAGMVAPQVRADYAAATKSDQTAADALSSFLRGQGAQGSAELGAKMGAINAPDTSVADSAAALGQGAGAEAASRGYARTAHTIGEGGVQAAYADTLPALAQLTGAGNLSKYEGDQAAALADARGQVTSQVPGTINSLLTDERKARADQRSATGTALGSFLSSALDRNTQANIASAGFGKDVYGIDVGAATDRAVADTRAAAQKAAAKKKQNKTHQTALHNLATAKVSAGKSVHSVAASLTKPHYEVKLVPGKGLAPPTKTKVLVPPPDYNEILTRVMRLPEVTILGTRYGVRPLVLQQLVADALRSAGVYPGYKLKPTGPPRPSGQPGKQPGEPPG